MTVTPSLKASLGTALFSVTAIFSWIFFVEDRLLSLPLLIFYAALMVHTYFSVRLFSSLSPKGNILQKLPENHPSPEGAYPSEGVRRATGPRFQGLPSKENPVPSEEYAPEGGFRGVSQIFFDFLLFLINTGMAFALGNPLLFLFLNLLLFIVAPMKYSFLFGIVNQPKLLKRKIIADLLGALAAALSLGAFSMGYERQSVWGLVIAFYITSVYLFFVRPLYRLDEEPIQRI